MLQALIDGQDDPAALAQMAKRKLRQKIPELTEALNGRFKDHHRYLAALYLRRIDAHTADINDLSARIEAAIEPFRQARELQHLFLSEIPAHPRRRGPMKALVAVEHAMLTAAWHMLTTAELYQDPGADYFTRHSPGRAKARALGQLGSLGYHVTLEPLRQTG